MLLSGGAPLSAKLKDEFLRRLPTLMIVDGLGSSEAGGQMSHVSTGGGATTGTFAITPGNHVLSADLDRELEPGDAELGWLAKSGRLALGYLNDATRPSARTRWSTGRGTRCPATGPACAPTAWSSCTAATRSRSTPVARRSSPRRSRPRSSRTRRCTTASSPGGRASVGARRSSPSSACATATASSRTALIAEAERHIARYKLPKEIVFVNEVVRSPSGKADYRWAKQVAASDY